MAACHAAAILELAMRANTGLGLVGPDHTFVWVNPWLAGRLGYTPGELQSMTWMDVTVEEDVDADAREAGRVAEGESPYYEMDKTYRRKDRSFWPVHLTVSRFDIDGAMACFLVHVEDREDYELSAARGLREQAERIGAMIGGADQEFVR